MKMKHLFLIMVLVVITLPLAAQEKTIFAPFVSRLQAEVNNNFVRLSWEDSRDVLGPVFVFRSEVPLEEFDSFLEITPVVVPYGVQTYTDVIEEGESFYYFAVASDERGLKYDFPIITNNTASVRVFIPQKVEPSALASLTLKRPRAFARDLNAETADSEEYMLISIVRGSFISRNWETAKGELLAFLSSPRSPDTKVRAQFYLGQCYYYLSQPGEGLSEFLAIQDKFPVEIAEWIQASRDMLKY